MKDTNQDTIRRRQGGSIDTDYYLQRGRIARSQSAYQGMASISQLVRRLLGLISGSRAKASVTPIETQNPGMLEDDRPQTEIPFKQAA